MGSNTLGLRRLLRAVSPDPVHDDTDTAGVHSQQGNHDHNYDGHNDQDGQDEQQDSRSSAAVAMGRLVKEKQAQQARDAEFDAQATTDSRPRESIISPGIVLDKGGVISGNQDIVCYGTMTNMVFDGINKLTIAPGGVVSGTIRAAIVRNQGRLEGTVLAHYVMLLKDSEVHGELRCRSVGVQPGCTIHARIDADSQVAVEDIEGAQAPVPTGFGSEFGLRLVHGSQAD